MTDDTQITRDGQRGGLENLKVGDEVTACYMVDGSQYHASTIAVRKRSL